MISIFAKNAKPLSHTLIHSWKSKTKVNTQLLSQLSYQKTSQSKEDIAQSKTLFNHSYITHWTQLNNAEDLNNTNNNNQKKLLLPNQLKRLNQKLNQKLRSKSLKCQKLSLKKLRLRLKKNQKPQLLKPLEKVIHQKSSQKLRFWVNSYHSTHLMICKKPCCLLETWNLRTWWPIWSEISNLHNNANSFMIIVLCDQFLWIMLVSLYKYNYNYCLIC